MHKSSIHHEDIFFTKRLAILPHPNPLEDLAMKHLASLWKKLERKGTTKSKSKERKLKNSRDSSHQPLEGAYIVQVVVLQMTQLPLLDTYPLRAILEFEP